MVRDYSFLLAVITALFWGSGPIFAKVGLKNVEPLVGMAWRSIAATTAVFVAIIAAQRTALIGQVSVPAIACLAAEGLAASAIGQFFFFWALKVGSPARVVPITSAFPLVTLLLAVLFLSQRLGWQHLVGTALVVAGVALLKLGS